MKIGTLSLLLSSAVSVFASSLLMTPVHAITLVVTVEDLAPSEGVGFSPFWFGFHDGTFDTFTPGESASLQLEILAEEGISGPEFFIPGVLDAANSFGAVLPEFEDTYAALFTATQPDGVQNIVSSPEVLGFLGGSIGSTVFEVNPTTHSFFSYASMVVPTNDGFVADADPVRLFSSEGNFISQQIDIFGSDVFDAGTEVNEETVETTPVSLVDAAQFFEAFSQGTPEGGAVRPHPLLLEPGQGGFLDLPFYENADFTRSPDQLLARITIKRQESEAIPEPGTALGLGIVLGLSSLRSLRIFRNSRGRQ